MQVERLRAKSCISSLDETAVRFASVRNAGITTHGFGVCSEAAKSLAYAFVEFVLYILEYRKSVIGNSDKRSKQTSKSKVTYF